MTKTMKFSFPELLPSLLKKKKTTTIRKKEEWKVGDAVSVVWDGEETTVEIPGMASRTLFAGILGKVRIEKVEEIKISNPWGNFHYVRCKYPTEDFILKNFKLAKTEGFPDTGSMFKRLEEYLGDSRQHTKCYLYTFRWL